MATHSSILAWRIPWKKELGGLQSMGSQTVKHDCSDLAHTYALQKVCIFIKILIRRKSFSKVTYMTKLKYI